MKIMKDLLVKLVDGLLYAFIGPFNVMYIIPKFLNGISDDCKIPRFTIPWCHKTGLYMTFAGAAFAIYCALLMFLFGGGTPLVSYSPRKLMKKNIYGIVRHPMMWAINIVLAGEILFFGSWVLILYLVVWLRISHIIVVNYEEPQLERRFGGEWAQYCRDVPRWIPSLKKKTGSDGQKGTDGK
jgi:protein-S-isoprenylcysteine O-methyltransferase Ste14